MSTVLSRDLSIELLKAMGCPVELCQGVSIEMQQGELAALTVRYTLNPDWLVTASAALKADG